MTRRVASDLAIARRHCALYKFTLLNPKMPY